MVVDSATKKFGLLVGKGDRHGLGLDFSGPAPVALWALAQTALRDPNLKLRSEFCSSQSVFSIQWAIWLGESTWLIIKKA